MRLVMIKLLCLQLMIAQSTNFYLLLKNWYLVFSREVDLKGVKRKSDSKRSKLSIGNMTLNEKKIVLVEM